ncbi:hypothetical protein PQO01_04790 [Lentisphaera marina]|uniref:hypothetical protein n=1 Tax=Lentisphaera marina TaxID=1111041 RepID=UPI002365A0B6|nr:hypothetical protein [Lentisphaera marina]MDD7984262.1 hypothetical protein [Lentisphaera marina]
MKNDDIIKMFQLMKEYSETEMDQWDQWKFDTKFGEVYIDFSRGVSTGEGGYEDISHFMNTENNKS